MVVVYRLPAPWWSNQLLFSVNGDGKRDFLSIGS